MGQMLLMAGSDGKRFMLPNSRVLMHQPLMGGVMQGQATDLSIQAKEMLRTRKRLFELMVHHTGQDYEKIARDCERDLWLDARETVEYGVADKVLEHLPAVKPQGDEATTTATTAMTPDRSAARLRFVAAAAALLSCACGPGDFANTNDDLRRENLQLQREVETLSTRLEHEVQAQRVLLGRAAGTPADLPEGVRPPVLVQVTMDRYGSAVDTDGDGLSDIVRLYVYPRDQQDRMLPTAGTLTARVVDLGGETPAVLGETTLGPGRLRQGLPRRLHRAVLPRGGAALGTRRPARGAAAARGDRDRVARARDRRPGADDAAGVRARSEVTMWTRILGVHWSFPERRV